MRTRTAGSFAALRSDWAAWSRRASSAPSRRGRAEDEPAYRPSGLDRAEDLGVRRPGAPRPVVQNVGRAVDRGEPADRREVGLGAHGKLALGEPDRVGPHEGLDGSGFADDDGRRGLAARGQAR